MYSRGRSLALPVAVRQCSAAHCPFAKDLLLPDGDLEQGQLAFIAAQWVRWPLLGGFDGNTNCICQSTCRFRERALQTSRGTSKQNRGNNMFRLAARSASERAAGVGELPDMMSTSDEEGINRHI